VSSVRHHTKTDIALAFLRDRITSGELRPGQRVRVEELAVELGMSPTPIREALRVLQADRLLEYKPHHAVVVAEVSTAEIDEIYRLRGVLEPMATELAVPKLTPPAIERLQQLQDDFDRASSLRNERSMIDLNAAWHWAIYDASASKYLTLFIKRLWESFPWRTIGTLPGRADSNVEEHRAILDAIVQRDAPTAALRMRLHIQESGALFRSVYGADAHAQESPDEHRLPSA
jgi:DNA-binding GntR family transcriptional regulator